MDYKEKYEMALERAKKFIEGNPLVQSLDTWIKETFPELAESEDERMRKAIHIYLDWLDGRKDYQPKGDYTIKDMLAWLEKQGEAYTKKDVDDAWLKGMCDAKDELDKQAEVVSDKDDIEAEEKGIRKAFNKIWEEKQDKQKSQRMISAEAKEAMYDKPADTVEQKCEENKTRVYDAPTPFEDKLFAFIAGCEFLMLPAKIEFIKEHSQELLDAAKEQIEKEETEWSEEDEKMVDNILTPLAARYPFDIYQPMYNWLKNLKQRIGG